MNPDLQKAIARLQTSSATCVLCRGEITYQTEEHGVKPLLRFMQAKTDLQGFSAADKVVGKAAALLYVLLGVRAVYAEVLSEAGNKILREHNIEVKKENIVPEIRNRTNTGMCPMEQTVFTIDQPAEAYEALKQKAAAMAQAAHP